MPFNAEEFRKRASAAGLSAEDIDAEIAYQSGGVKKDEPFAKNESGFQLSTPEQIHQRLGTDWWHLPVGLAIGTGLGVAGKALFDARAAKAETPTPRVEPTLENAGIAPPAAEPVDRLQLATERAAQGRAAGLGLKPPVQAPAAPIPPAAPIAAEPPAAVAEVPAIAEEAPKTAVALQTEQPGSQVATAVVKDELAKPVEPPAAEKNISGRTRRTKAQIEKELAQSFANAPAGMRPAAPAKTNKLPGDVIGQGGWHFFAGQGGDPEEWLRFYGRQPQPYQRVVSDIKGGLLKVPPPAPGAMGGTVPRQPYVPEFIRGRASAGGLPGLAAIAAAFGLAGSEKGREAMSRAAAAIQDIGISPDIFQGKGEELGRLGRGYVTAGNPAYLRELNAQLKTETNPQRRMVLEEEIRKAGGQ